MKRQRIISWVYPSNTQKQHRDIAFYRIKPDLIKSNNLTKIQQIKGLWSCKNAQVEQKCTTWIEMNQVKNVSKEKTSHPCQIPLELMRKNYQIITRKFNYYRPFLWFWYNIGCLCFRELSWCWYRNE